MYGGVRVSFSPFFLSGKGFLTERLSAKDYFKFLQGSGSLNGQSIGVKYRILEFDPPREQKRRGR